MHQKEVIQTKFDGTIVRTELEPEMVLDIKNVSYGSFHKIWNRLGRFQKGHRNFRGGNCGITNHFLE